MSSVLLEKLIVAQLVEFGSGKLLLVLAITIFLSSESREAYCLTNLGLEF
jgi:hypothetical protein